MTAGAVNENEAHPRRLQFGFAPELEQLVHDKVESSADLCVTFQFFSQLFSFSRLHSNFFKRLITAF